MKTLTKTQFRKAIETISKQMPADYSLSKALLYGISFDEDNNITFNEIASSGDVYELLNPFTAIEKMKGFDFFSVVTCGWAAPNNQDDDEDNAIPPSQHPDKRRVMLTVNATTDNKIGSVISFQDDQENPVFDYGDAKGQLAEAIAELIDCYKMEQE